ncbi:MULTISPECIES: glycosyltransferase family 2 protein [Pseudomonas]|uniref:glycosyltransferase family 2 protein n=1 Tax=Pseudomonas TaxID=286 RepID=UPI0009BA62CE|nr:MULTISPECIES: glycosyltransferase family 2 protein [Pseudomonas]UUT21635.1 glycosyltransferase family 2 protein [Pseudomonas sp. T8]
MEQQPPQPGYTDTELFVPPSTRSPSPFEVAILLCTYNGQAFLKEQIDSILAQTHQEWTLYISDDGSTDKTIELLEEYQLLIDEQRIKIFNGPRKGFAANFMSLIRNKGIKADFFAFSDQDDIWKNNKLERSIQHLALLPSDLPALYCSRTRLIDEDQNNIGFSPEFKREPTFKNALIQSISGANTMLLNNAARELLSLIPDTMKIVAHDWLAYLLTTACGGRVVYDQEPTLDYRQHGGNLIGAGSSIKERMIRFQKLIDGQFRDWSDLNLKALEIVENKLPPENHQTLIDFRQGRQDSFFTRLRLMKKSGIYRQTLMDNISLAIAICLNKI